MELTAKTNEAEDELSNLKCIIESFRMNFEMQKMRIGMNCEDIQEIQEKLESMGSAPTVEVSGGNIDLAALSKSFASKSDFDKFNERLTAIEKNDSK